MFNLTKAGIILISGEGGRVTQEVWEGARFGTWNDGLGSGLFPACLVVSENSGRWSSRPGRLSWASFLFLEATEVLVVGQGDALALPVLQEGCGSEGLRRS